MANIQQLLAEAVLYHDYRRRDAIDLSGNGNNGVITDVNFSRNGASFNTTTSAVTVAHNANQQITEGSFVFYFKDGIKNPSANVQRLIEKSSGTDYDIYLAAALTGITFVDGGSNPSVVTNLVGKKYIGINFKTGEIPQLYLDGVFTSAFSIICSIGTSTSAITLMNRAAGTRQNTNTCSSALMFNRELTASEHAELYGYLSSLKFPSKVTAKAKANLQIPLSEPNLIASYNMGFLNNEVVDRKNSYNLTPVDTFNSGQNLYGDYLEFNGSSNYLTIAQSPDYAEPATSLTVEALVYLQASDFNGSLKVIADSSTGNTGANGGLFLALDDRGAAPDKINAIKAGFGTTTGSNSAYIADAFGSEGLYHIVATYDGTSTIIWVNCSSTGCIATSSDTGAYNPRNFQLDVGRLANFNGYYFKNRMVYFNMYDSVADQAWVDSRCVPLKNLAPFKTDWAANVSDANVAGGFIENTPFIRSTGSWKVVSDTIGGETVKAIECMASGIIYMPLSVMGQSPAEAAYGEWEWWMSKAADSNFDLYMITDPDFAGGSTNGYMFRLSSTERIGLKIIAAGSPSNLVFSSEGVLADDTWGKINLTRTSTGIFSLYLNDTLTDSDFVGTNPVTDNTYTAVNYLVLDLDTGDKIALSDISGNYSITKKLT